MVFAHVFVGARTAALDNEVRRDAVEGQTVVIALAGTARDADRRQRRGIDVETDVEKAAAGHVKTQGLAAKRSDHRRRHARRGERLGRRRPRLPRPGRQDLRGLPRDRRIEILQVAFEILRLRSVAVRLEPRQDRHARIARRVLVRLRDAPERGDEWLRGLCGIRLVFERAHGGEDQLIVRARQRRDRHRRRFRMFEIDQRRQCCFADIVVGIGH